MTVKLSRAAGDTILRLLEQPECTIVERTLIDRCGQVATELTVCGAVVPAGTASFVLVADDRGERQVDVDWDAQRNAYCYFDAADGFVEVPASSLQVLRLDLQWWLQWLAEHLELGNAGRPFELVPGRAWDLGDLWMTKQSKVPVLFARRQRSRAAVQTLRTAMEARRGRVGGILLSSTATIDVSAPWPLRFQQHPIARILTTDASRFALERDAITIGYGAKPALPSAGINLSPDNRVLSINGSAMTFRGPEHQSILRKLVDAHAEGIRLRTADVLAGLSSNSFAKAFRKNPNWPQLRDVIRQDNGICWLDV